jgi:uncharacterized membrane protein YkoI
MKSFVPLLILGLLSAPAPVADAQRRSDQERAFDARRQGSILSPRDVERRVQPTMPGYQYLGFDVDFETAIYTLKFLRDGTVVWVDVDARTGAVLRRSR